MSTPIPKIHFLNPSAPEQGVCRASHAKINVHLEILRKREDGFHDISSRLCALELHDDVTVRLSKTGEDHLETNRSDIPTDRSNLVWRAVDAFRERTGTRAPLSVALTKRIPPGAGLGGGSGNAATVLRALNDLNGEPLLEEDLRELAAGIGSDVPFFLGPPVCDVSGRGEILTPVRESHMIRLPLLLIKPAFPVPTAWAYQNWNGSDPVRQLTPWGPMFNDLEAPVFTKYPVLLEIKHWLRRDAGVVAALMSGSGSTIFAVPATDTDGVRLLHEATARYGEGTWTCLTRTLGHV